jgi:transposase
MVRGHVPVSVPELGMAARFQNIDRETPMLLPACIQDWVPDNDLAHFIIDAVATLNLDNCSINHRGTGDARFPPAMMLTLLIYCYATGLFSSRRLEHASFQNLSVRFICANTHPDHDTICAFRRKNGPLIAETFLKTLLLARELKLLKVGTVAIDGTKVLAHASKHAANSYGKAGELIVTLENEVAQLLAKAAAADSTPLKEGLTIQGEVVRRETRLAQLRTAREIIEARAREDAALEKTERASALAERQARQARGEKLRGKGPAGPGSVDETPSPEAQYNYTDPESRIMKTGSGFEQSYNAQAAVEIDSRLIIGQRVTDAPNDKEQLAPTLASIPAGLGKPSIALTDSGFYSEAAVAGIEALGADGLPQTQIIAAVVRPGHHRSVADLESKDDPPPPGPGATAREDMIHRSATKAGKALYKQRQQTVEPVFGIIKSAMGFRQFLLRGKGKVSLEWSLVSLTYNMRRLHTLGMRALLLQRAA